MPEGNINAEVAEHLREHDPGHTSAARREKRRVELVEILEAVLLAVVALATALSGFEAALFDGESAREYATSSKLRVEAQTAEMTGNQQAIYNAVTLNDWIQAMTLGQKTVAAEIARRFMPDFQPWFKAWLKTDPLTNPAAPAGPRMMPGYEDVQLQRADRLNERATEAYAAGVDTRTTAEKYVRVTVILAAVLFLIALGQRFSLRGVRIGVNVVAGVLLVYCFVLIAVYPHLFMH